MSDQFNRFFVCLLDVLGFESRFKDSGLSGILEKYIELVEVVDSRNAATEQWFGSLQFSEGAYWTAERAGFVSTRLYGAYASDSVVLFSHADFPENRYPAILGVSEEERSQRAKDPAQGWLYQTVPCDNFLDLCNEVLCRSIEIGLPLRGAISLGQAVLHLDRGIYLGQPLIDAARLEKPQQCIGASFASSFMKQVIPERYRIDHDEHFKAAAPPDYAGCILDWPRHWRASRTESLEDAIASLDTDERFSDYYTKTQAIAAASLAQADKYDGPEHTYMTKVYPQFSSPDLELHTLLFRAEARQEPSDEK